jgi:hypothetical protein
MAGTRVIRIGGAGLDYDMAGSRVRRIGAAALDYDMLGTRPKRLEVAAEAIADEALVAIFYVLVFTGNDA